ncbi:flagellar protein FliT [methane-oxidizing endosymbiont of Gigantopelta aegis]|uniref:flagellar protein FliT n=1 Tax=methane-oxidizing endosymbiont of Gigantopelta aegis TaxID=2794938 RepID=UPI0018DB2A43|nr:flagellar protein FliT [methane-oxidizing endosymbiont of Gigantopelta aegis]
MGEQSQAQHLDVWQSEFEDMMLKIRQAIAESDWDALNVMLQQRQKWLEIFCQQFNTEESNVQDVSEWLKQLKQDDRELMAQIQRQQQAIRQALADLDKGRKAINAYQT